MPTWVIAVLAFIAGVILGFIVSASCMYDAIKNPGRKWWEE